MGGYERLYTEPHDGTNITLILLKKALFPFSFPRHVLWGSGLRGCVRLILSTLPDYIYWIGGVISLNKAEGGSQKERVRGFAVDFSVSA